MSEAGDGGRLARIRERSQQGYRAYAGTAQPRQDVLTLLDALAEAEARLAAAERVIAPMRAWAKNSCLGKSQEQYEFELAGFEDQMLEALDAYDAGAAAGEGEG